MIDIKWGKKISSFPPVKKHLFRISSNSVSYRNMFNSEMRYFLKYNKRSFAICKPTLVSFWENINWIFGWSYHPKTNIVTGLLDGVLLEIHFYKMEIAVYR